jgi:hypothetical protein
MAGEEQAVMEELRAIAQHQPAIHPSRIHGSFA